jgi:hypothetical protein
VSSSVQEDVKTPLLKRLGRVALFMIVAWLVHLVFVSVYMSFFDDYSVAGFRLLHFFEALFVSWVVYSFYFSSSSYLGVKTVVAVVLILLALIDLGFWLARPELFEGFDFGHFLAVYLAVVAGIVLSRKKSV